MSLNSPQISFSGNGGGAYALNANVLVLNRFYQAIRVINVRRAFSLLCKELAEVVHIETDTAGQSRWQNFNFVDWREISQLKAEFEPEEYDWIHTVRFQIAVPRIIRLLAYEKLPRQEVKFNRRNIYARDSNRCQYCGKRMSTTELSLDHVLPKSQGGRSSWGKYCLLLRKNATSKKAVAPPSRHSCHLITRPVKPKAAAPSSTSAWPMRGIQAGNSSWIRRIGRWS